MSLNETVTFDGWEFEIKRYTLKDTLAIQSLLAKSTKEDGTIDEKKVDYEAFYLESILRGLVKAKYNGQELPISKELILSLDTELANSLLAKITELNKRNFFQVKK
jgi:hypothetical protein